MLASMALIQQVKILLQTFQTEISFLITILSIIIVGFAVNVMNKYFDEYFPRAIRLGKELENDKSGKT